MKGTAKADMDRILDAIHRNDQSALIGLMESGIDINARDRDGRTVLMYAVIDHDVDTAKLLMENGADVNVQDKGGWSALHFAAQRYLTGIAEVLLRNGADVDIQDSNGNMPLWRGVFSSEGRGGTDRATPPIRRRQT